MLSGPVAERRRGRDREGYEQKKDNSNKRASGESNGGRNVITSASHICSPHYRSAAAPHPARMRGSKTHAQAPLAHRDAKFAVPLRARTPAAASVATPSPPRKQAEPARGVACEALGDSDGANEKHMDWI